MLQEKYVIQGLSLAKIAGEFLCSKTTIRKALTDAGVPIRERQQKGRSSNPRYGTRSVKGQRVEHMGEHRVIKTIVEMREEGLSFRQIADFLTKVGVPTKTRRKKWHKEVVRQIYLTWSVSRKC